MIRKKPTALVTAGPTRERIDPIRYISNFSSGKQGYAIAKALHKNGFDVTLVTGPVAIKPPKGVKIIAVESAEDMLQACLNNLPKNIAICAAAICDFRPIIISKQKLKKENLGRDITIKLTKNPDILKTISNHKLRPKIVVGFAAETENVIENAKRKLQTKSCDMIIANDVSDDKVFNKNSTYVHIITPLMVEKSLNGSKDGVAEYLVSRICKLL